MEPRLPARLIFFCLSLCLGALVVGFSVIASGNPAQRWWKHVHFLASDAMRGRETGSAEHRKAAEYVAQQFEKAGLKPAGNSGWFQTVKFRSRRINEAQSSLALVRDGKAQPLVLGEDAYFSMRIEPAPSVEAPLVFAGYGLTVPELNYNDFANIDARGKIAVVLAGGPAFIPEALRSHYQSAGERWKALKQAGAIGAIRIANPDAMDIPWERQKLSRFNTSLALADPALDETAGQQVSVVFNPAQADLLLAGSGHTLAEVLKVAAQGKPLPVFSLPVSARIKVAVQRGELESQNVAAVLPGADAALRNEYLVLSAHLDHVGAGQPIKGDRIYNGAMDNAAGVATLLEIAAALQESNARPRRSLLFLAVTAEEKGLLGSRYFAANPTVPAAGIVANLNVDMFLPIYAMKSVIVYGADESDLGDDVRAVAREIGISVMPDPEPHRNSFIRSDQYNFIRGGVPALAFKIGYKPNSPEAAQFRKWLTERYHAPSDDLRQPVDFSAAATFNSFLRILAVKVADRESRPAWKGQSFFRRYGRGGG